MDDIRVTNIRQLGVLVIFAFALTVLGNGCATTKYTDTETPRGATEQLLLSTAAERSATRIKVPDFHGVPLYLEVTGFTKDAEFAKETVASELLARGAVIVTEAAKATYTVKILVQAFGTDQKEWFLGIPAMTAIVPIPEIALFKRRRQTARSRLRYTVIDTRTGRIVGQAQEAEGKTTSIRWTVLFFTFKWSDGAAQP